MPLHLAVNYINQPIYAENIYTPLNVYETFSRHCEYSLVSWSLFLFSLFPGAQSISTAICITIKGSCFYHWHHSTDLWSFTGITVMNISWGSDLCCSNKIFFLLLHEVKSKNRVDCFHHTLFRLVLHSWFRNLNRISHIITLAWLIITIFFY